MHMAPSAPPMTQDLQHGTFDRTRVLIIDDEDRIRHVCTKMLRQEGCDVDQAENADLGLQRLAERHFDIILLDLLMPGMSGIEALNHIRTRHPDTVVIVITGYATLDHAIRAMKNGAFDFISKPFSPQDLRLVVAKAVEHIRTLQDIAHQQSRMRTMVDHLPGGVMATDIDKTVALANHAFSTLIGYRGPNPIGHPVDKLVGDPEVLRMIDQAIHMPKDQFAEEAAEIRVKTAGIENERILSVRCVPFRDRLKRNLGVITVLHDITAIKQMDQMKSDFVSMVGHEVRGPLNSVLMQHQVILDELAGQITPKQRAILQRASEKIEALVNLSSELLDLAKMESGLISMEKEALSLAPILADQVAFHQIKAQAKGIQLALQAPPDLPPVLANRMHMEVVLTNLISNAIRYTPEQGNITVSANGAGDFVCLQVCDTGLGIAPEDQERIFSRFYRVKNEQTRYIVGTGLGLPIVKGIVEAHNGRIEVESQVGQGSTFSVFIPIIRR